MRGKPKPRLTAEQRAEVRQAVKVAEIEMLARLVARVRHGDYRVPSRTEADVTYHVVQIPDGRLTCSCPWNALRGRVCAHIQAVERRRAIEAAKRASRRPAPIDAPTSAPGMRVLPPGGTKTSELPPEARSLRRVSFV